VGGSYYTVCENVVLCCQTFTKWKSEIDVKLKEEKKKQLRQERRVKEAKKEDEYRKREDATSAFQQWCVLIAVCYDSMNF